MLRHALITLMLLSGTSTLLAAQRSDCGNAAREISAAACAQAIADISRTIALDPRNAKAYFDRAAVHMINDDPARALADLDQAIQLKPDFADAYMGRGVVLNGMGDLERAIADHDRAIRLNPRLALAYSNRGLAYFRKRDFSQALADYNAALRVKPDARAYKDRGIVHLALGKLDLAMSDLNQAIQIDANFAPAYASRGDTSLRLGQIHPAIEDYDRAVRLNPRFGPAYLGRGIAYEKLGERDKAKADYLQALALDPANSVVRARLRRLEVAMMEAAEGDAAPIRLTLPNHNWELEITAKGFVTKIDQTTADGKGRRFLATNNETGLTLSAFLEKNREKDPWGQSGKQCRDYYWEKLRTSPQKREQLNRSDDGEKALLGYTINASAESLPPEIMKRLPPGLSLHQRNLNVYLARDGVCIDVHLSRMLSKPGEEPQFDDIVKSIRFADAPR